MESIELQELEKVARSGPTQESLLVKPWRPSPAQWLKTVGWRHAVGLITCIVALFPLLYVLSASLNPSGTLTGSNELFRAFSLQNFVDLLPDPGRPFLRWWFNTILVASVTAVASVSE